MSPKNELGVLFCNMDVKIEFKTFFLPRFDILHVLKSLQGLITKFYEVLRIVKTANPLINGFMEVDFNLSKCSSF